MGEGGGGSGFSKAVRRVVYEEEADGKFVKKKKMGSSFSKEDGFAKRREIGSLSKGGK